MDADVLLHLVDATRPADEERVWKYYACFRKTCCAGNQ